MRPSLAQHSLKDEDDQLDRRLKRQDDWPLDLARNEVLCFACVRNEELRLPYFLEYHRRLGVDRFFFIDNASEDRTRSYLLLQKDVHVFLTEESYASSNCGVAWLNCLLARYGPGHWTLTLDADELLIYPRCEVLDLRQLVRFLDNAGTQGLVTFLLDMYSDQTIRETAYQPGAPFLDACPWFDPDTYHERDSGGIPVRGGPRHRLFWAGHDRKKPSPVLKKTPLVKWANGMMYEASTHTIRDLRLSSLTGALLHFKFFSSFYDQVREEVARKEHWDGAAQYESYLDVLIKNPNLTAFFDGSKRYNDSAQLVRLGLMKEPRGFDSRLQPFCDAQCSSSQL
jgi:hypothetical protein